MSLYCGIDLHSNHVVVVTDEEDNKVVDKRIDNNLNATLALLAPYKEQIKAVTIESTFNWYWLGSIGVRTAGLIFLVLTSL